MAWTDRFAVRACILLAGVSGCTQTLDFDATSREAGDEPVFSCAKQPIGTTFCDDFEGKPLLESWTSIMSSGTTGALSTDGGDSVSPSHSMLASYPGKPASTDFTAITALKSFPDFANANISVAIDFDMKVEAVDPANNARVSAFQFLFGNLDAYNQLVLNLESRTTEVSAEFTENFAKTMAGATVDQGTNAGGIREAPNLRQWSHVRFELEVNQAMGTNNTVKAFIDGVKLFDGGLKYNLFGLTPRLELGMPYVNVTNATGAWSVRYDNVLVAIKTK